MPKVLFEQVQESRSLPNKAAWGTKNFAYKEIFKCGTCGASITAEEKFKLRIDGGFNRHVYYHCTKKVDPTCPERFINEVDLNSQLIEFIAKNCDEIKVTDELARKMIDHTEIVDYSLSSRGVEHDAIDPLTEYARYVLVKGTYAEQGKLVEGIRSQFVIRNRILESQ